MSTKHVKSFSEVPLTHCSYGLHYLPAVKNEDRILDCASGVPGICDGVVGVCDGHGGNTAAEYVVSNFTSHLQLELGRADFEVNSWPSDSNEKLTRVFHKLNEEVTAQSGSGTTCTVCLVRRDGPLVHIKVAWVGDSRAVCIQGKEARPVTADHRMTSPSELRRIKAFYRTLGVEPERGLRPLLAGERVAIDPSKDLFAVPIEMRGPSMDAAASSGHVSWLGTSVARISTDTRDSPTAHTPHMKKFSKPDPIQVSLTIEEVDTIPAALFTATSGNEPRSSATRLSFREPPETVWTKMESLENNVLLLPNSLGWDSAERPFSGRPLSGRLTPLGSDPTSRATASVSGMSEPRDDRLELYEPKAANSSPPRKPRQSFAGNFFDGDRNMVSGTSRLFASSGVSTQNTRSIGDRAGARSVISTPEIVDLTFDGPARIVIASDGLWDNFDEQWVEKVVRNVPDAGKASEKICKKVRNQCDRLWLKTDDTAVIVLDILPSLREEPSGWLSGLCDCF